MRIIPYKFNSKHPLRRFVHVKENLVLAMAALHMGVLLPGVRQLTAAQEVQPFCLTALGSASFRGDAPPRWGWAGK